MSISPAMVQSIQLMHLLNPFILVRGKNGQAGKSVKHASHLFQPEN